MNAKDVIALLSLQPHPKEGGFFRETYRSPLSTAIYYLLTPETFSAMHKLPGDEIFHFYLGDAVEMLQLFPDGTGKFITIGSDIDDRAQPQVVVPGGTWQGSRLLPGGTFALLGTTMSPAFEYPEYEAGSRETLTKAFPKFEKHIQLLTLA
ncbi:MAG: cupin domain-containing protein [Candidatus Peribacteraceae bacterium]|nr:cupin domain-containing protein [Candidatus Peribacteraceae bacterium]